MGFRTGMVAALAAVVMLAGAAAAAPPPASTDAGPVQGVVRGGVVSYLGIPFAAPPVGALRWRAPAPAAPWTAVRLADHFGAPCMQNLQRGAPGGGQTPSEDCLYLNVWTPAGAKPGDRLPVMVWIYGGGFNIGATSWPQYDGTSLARRGVVLVSIAYRLGRFGFFAHPALTRESPDGPLGNYGVLDMIQGLKWVRRNAAAFGGDPANVTVFGESAGGMAVNMLMTSPYARGLFQKAIVESGGPFPMASFQKAEADGVAAARRWGVAGDDPAALRAVPAAVVLGDATMTHGGSDPMVDGRIAPEPVLQAFRAGRIAHVPFMVGTNSYEAGLFPAWSKGLRQRYADQWGRIAAAYDGYGTHDPKLVAGELATDMRMTLPARSVARGAARAGLPTYAYVFAYLRPSQRGKTPGAVHFDEVYQVFGTPLTAPPPTADDPAIVEAVQSRWVGFARSGRPSADWPAFLPGDERVLEFTDDGVKVERNYAKARLDVAQSLPPAPAP